MVRGEVEVPEADAFRERELIAVLLVPPVPTENVIGSDWPKESITSGPRRTAKL